MQVLTLNYLTIQHALTIVIWKIIMRIALSKMSIDILLQSFVEVLFMSTGLYIQLQLKLMFNKHFLRGREN